MNYKELLIPIFFAMGITVLFNYFMRDRLAPKQETEQTVAGQRFIAPEKEIVSRPLNTEIDFVDAKSDRPTHIVEIDTDLAHYEFSNDGATLVGMTIKRFVDGKHQLLQTITPPPAVIKEDRCFIVGLDRPAPYYFKLVSQDETEYEYRLTYRASFGDGLMNKTFVVHKDRYQVDLELAIDPRAGLSEPIRARIFFPSAQMPDIAATDVIAGIANKPGSSKSIEFNKPSDNLWRTGWQSPTLFGSQSKYFVNALVKDEQSFVVRAYYKQWGPKGMISILEGPAVVKDGSWDLSFYLGPKESPAFDQVDPRLDQTLEYGWFAFVSKFLLSFLRWIADYTHNFGLAIIVLTILIKLLLLPLTISGTRNMEKQTELSKKIKYVKQKYKHDKDALAREQEELVRKYGVPGIGGCLPMFLQIPVFFALSAVLRNSIELYQAPFLWISDLSAKDPYYILPIITMVSMAFSMPSQGDAKKHLTSLLMALVMGVFFANFSAGLLLYIAVFQISTAAQTYVQKRFA